MNRNRFYLLVLILLAFILRVYRLDFFSLRGDEAFTVIFVQRTWEGLWKGISTIEPNPPLMYLTLRAWVAIAGASEFATRYFSVFFGVAGVPLIYRLARELFKGTKGTEGNIAVITAALVAINPYQIWHSQDVRNYSMWPALSLLALIFFSKWWKDETDNKPLGFGIWFLGFYVLATLASLYTHYYDVFILAALNLFVFTLATFERRWRTLARWIGAQIVLVALYAPWVLFGTNRITTYGEASAEQSVPLIEQFRRTITAFVVGEDVPDELRNLIWLPLALGVAAVLLYLLRKNFQRGYFLLLYLAMPTLALYILSLGRPLFLERYLNGIAPAYYLAFAVGIAALWKWQAKRRAVAVAVPAIFFIAMSGYALWNYEFVAAHAKATKWREVTQIILQQLQPGDIVVQNFTEMSPLYYLAPRANVLTVPKDFWYRESDEKFLRQLNADYRRIWFLPALPGWWDPNQNVEQFLARTDERIFETQVDSLRLQLYRTPREFESTLTPVNARVGNATLTGYRVETGRSVHLILAWRANQATNRDYTIFVHLVDANGVVAAQVDRAPAFGLYPTSAWQAGETVIDVYDVPIGTPGKYALVIGMYDPASLVRAPAFDAKGNRLSDDSIILTQIDIPK